MFAYMFMFYIRFTTVLVITNVVEKSEKGNSLFTLFVYWSESRLRMRLGAPKPGLNSPVAFLLLTVPRQ